MSYVSIRVAVEELNVLFSKKNKIPSNQTKGTLKIQKTRLSHEIRRHK